MQLKDIRALVVGDLAAVDTEIRRQLASDVALVNQVGDYIVGGGGKRLRPLLVVLAARAAGAKDSTHIPAAALIEFIHTATLLHDDVVDDSARRRGRETANHAFGNPASVLVGDFLYSRAFQMMATLDSAAIIRVMADATNTIAAGEVLQLMNSGDPDTTEIRYMEVIYRKTARLFEAGAQIAAIVARAPASVEAALARFGRIDAVVNSAGHGPKGRLLEISDDDWRRGMEFYLLNVVRLARYVTPVMVKQGRGAIVNVSTYALFEPDAAFPTSGVFRSGLAAFTKLYADEYAAAGVRMNNILPGFISSMPVKSGPLRNSNSPRRWL